MYSRHWDIADSLILLEDNFDVRGVGMENWRLVYVLLQTEYKWYMKERMGEKE
jgi:hypothetical protein